MITAIIPKLPMRDKSVTRDFYVGQLGFVVIGTADFNEYLMLQKGTAELHFFEFKNLDPLENYGQVYIRTNNIEAFYNSIVEDGGSIHPSGHLQAKPWGQKEFSMLDPDNNLLTFGQAV